MSITLAMLSWGSHKTLENTLNSYQKHGLLNHVDERIIFFQEASDQDRKIADQYGFEMVISASENIGIAKAYQHLLEMATKDCFLFLENDWELIRDNWKPQIVAADILIRSGLIDGLRLRHRQNPGHPLWTRQFEGREHDKPSHMLDAVHWTERPEDLGFMYVDYYLTELQTHEHFWIVPARYANWTNNPTIFRKSFLMEHIHPRLGSGDIERDIQGWWEQQDFMIAQGEGLFTHNRLDR